MKKTLSKIFSSLQIKSRLAKSGRTHSSTGTQRSSPVPASHLAIAASSSTSSASTNTTGLPPPPPSPATHSKAVNIPQHIPANRPTIRVRGSVEGLNQVRLHMKLVDLFTSEQLQCNYGNRY